MSAYKRDWMAKNTRANNDQHHKTQNQLMAVQGKIQSREGTLDRRANYLHSRSPTACVPGQLLLSRCPCSSTVKCTGNFIECWIRAVPATYSLNLGISILKWKTHSSRKQNGS